MRFVYATVSERPLSLATGRQSAADTPLEGLPIISRSMFLYSTTTKINTTKFSLPSNYFLMALLIYGRRQELIALADTSLLWFSPIIRDHQTGHVWYRRTNCPLAQHPLSIRGRFALAGMVMVRYAMHNASLRSTNTILSTASPDVSSLPSIVIILISFSLVSFGFKMILLQKKK